MLKTDDNCSGAKSTYTATDYYCETIDKEKQDGIRKAICRKHRQEDIGS